MYIHKGNLIIYHKKCYFIFYRQGKKEQFIVNVLPIMKKH